MLHRNHLLPVGANVRMEEPESRKQKKIGKGEVKKAGNKKSRVIKEKDVREQKKAECSEEEVVDVSSSEDSGSEVDEDSIAEKRKVSQPRRRKKPEVLMYHRMGSPGQVNRVYTPHSIQNHNKTTAYHNEQNNTFLPHINKMKNTNNAQTHQTNNLQNKRTLQTQQNNNSQNISYIQTPLTYNTQHNNLYNAERSHEEHRCPMEHSFLIQMLEQQQVLTSMMFSVMLQGNC